MRGAQRLLPLALLGALLALAGCDDAGRAERWRIERARWRAARLAESARRHAPPDRAKLARSAAGLARLHALDRLAHWRGAPGARAAEIREGLAGAEMELAGFEFERGQPDAALARIGALAATEGLLTANQRARALAERADLLERAGRSEAARAAWMALAAEPVLDDSARALPGVLQAAGRAAALASGDAGDTLWRDAEARWREAVPRARDAESRAALARAIGTARAARGDSLGAFEAGRTLLAALPRGPERASLLFTLAQFARGGGLADSCRRYAAWAADSGAWADRPHALLLLARSFAATGPRDSALAAYDRLLARHARAQDFVAAARFERGALLERDGLWELARSEYRTLIAALPTHERSFEAVLRIVRHHVHAGEEDLARLEARRALDQMDLLIATQHNDAIQQRAHATRDTLRALTGLGSGAP